MKSGLRIPQSQQRAQQRARSKPAAQSKVRDKTSHFSLLMQLPFSGVGFDSLFLFLLVLSKIQLCVSHEQIFVPKYWVMGEGFQCSSSSCTHEPHFHPWTAPPNFLGETGRGSRDRGHWGKNYWICWHLLMSFLVFWGHPFWPLALEDIELCCLLPFLFFIHPCDTWTHISFELQDLGSSLCSLPVFCLLFSVKTTLALVNNIYMQTLLGL